MSTPVTYLAPTAPSVAQRMQYVVLGPAVQKEIWFAQESVRIATHFFAFLFRSHTTRCSGCPDASGVCCPNVGCCPGGQVSVCTLPTTWQISHSVFHRSALLRLMEKLGAALLVKPVLPSLVSEPSKHNSGSRLNLNLPRMRGPYSCGVSWRELLLRCW